MATIERDRNRLQVDTHAGGTYLDIGFALRGEPSPCMSSTSNAWLSDNPDERKQAAAACEFCPAVAECFEFARATRAEFGVYGGKDFTKP